MNKINDRITLGIVAGLVGTIAKVLVDEISIKKKISQRSYRETAAGVWVQSRKQARSFYGQILGTLMDLGLSSLGSVMMVNLLTKGGKDHLLVKGTFFGISFGSTVTAILSGFQTNKVGPKDPQSNLSYVASNAIYGIVTTLVAAKLGDDLLWDTPPTNNYLKPTMPTTEQLN